MSVKADDDTPETLVIEMGFTVLFWKQLVEDNKSPSQNSKGEQRGRFFFLQIKNIFVFTRLAFHCF